MIANFFKQSKPIVYVVLGLCLSFFYLLEFTSLKIPFTDWSSLALILLRFLGLVFCFIAFSWTLKYYEIQKNHNYGALLFVLLSSFIMPVIVKTNFIFGLSILSFGLIRLLDIIKSSNPVLKIFEATFLIVLSSIIYQPFIYFLMLVLSSTLIFLSPQWRFFIAPVLAISAVVVLVEMYFLIWLNEFAYLDFFISKWVFHFDFNLDTSAIILASIWFVSTAISIYQIVKVKQKRALYHNEIASFFLSFLGLSLLAYSLSNSSIRELWLLSLWPLSIYLGDFLSDLNSRKWRETLFWCFVGFALLNIITYYF